MSSRGCGSGRPPGWGPPARSAASASPPPCAPGPSAGVFAPVGVGALAPAGLERAPPRARIVVPPAVRGPRLPAAFERAARAVPGGPWTSRSLAPCGFMRMRGSLAGPERVVLLAPGLSLLLPDGTPEVNIEALAEILAGPPMPHPTGVRAESAQVFWGLGLYPASREPRSCRLNEERPAGRRRAPRTLPPPSPPLRPPPPPPPRPLAAD